MPTHAQKTPPKSNPPLSKSFKILLLGDAAVGKSSLLQQLTSHVVSETHVATVGAVHRVLHFQTADMVLRFDCWDVAGADCLAGERSAHYAGAQGVILMFDVQNPASYRSVPEWHKKGIQAVCPEAPVVLVGNKVELRGRQVLPKQIFYHRKQGWQYYDISVKENYNCVKPFLYLARKLTGEASLQTMELIEKPPN